MSSLLYGTLMRCVLLPLASTGFYPGRCKRFGKVLRFAPYFAVPKLHDAYCYIVQRDILRQTGCDLEPQAEFSQQEWIAEQGLGAR